MKQTFRRFLEMMVFFILRRKIFFLNYLLLVVEINDNQFN